MTYDETRALQDQVTEFKRSGNLEKAVTLLEYWINREEVENGKQGQSVASWPYYQLAVIARKQKRFDDEISILERYVQQPSSGSKQGQELYQRLVKAYEIADSPKSDMDPLFTRKALLIDTETTGLSQEDEVIEVGMILFQYSHLSGRILDIEAEYTGLRQPSFKIPPAAMAKHGITDKEVRGKNLDAAQIRQMIIAADILIAHNATYDRRMLSNLFPEVSSKPWYCSMNGIDWAGNGCSSKKLETLLTHYGISKTQNHRAIDDARMAFALLSQINAKTEQPFFYELIRDQPISYVSTYDNKRGRREQVVEIRIAPSNSSQPPKPRGLWGWLKIFSR